MLRLTPKQVEKLKNELEEEEPVPQHFFYVKHVKINILKKIYVKEDIVIRSDKITQRGFR